MRFSRFAVWWIVVNVVNGEVLIAHYLRSRLYSSSTWCGSKHFFLHFWQVQFADCFTEKAITSQSFGYSFLFIGMLFLSKKWRSQFHWVILRSRDWLKVVVIGA
jgi:hypothetical protein